MFPNRVHIQDETRTLYMVAQERETICFKNSLVHINV